MPKTRFSSRELLKALHGHGCYDDRCRGSHQVMKRKLDDGTIASAVVQLERDTIPQGTIGSIRRALKLTAADGVSDEVFANPKLAKKADEKLAERASEKLANKAGE